MLRDYQLTLQQDVYTAWRDVPNVVAQLPTGGGKSEIIKAIIAEEDGASCTIAHRQELVSQLSMSFARAGIRHRLIAADAVVRNIVRMQVDELGQSYYDPNAKRGIAGVDTLVRMAPSDRWLSSVKVWVQDECFPAGTRVFTPDGDVDIDCLQPGDMVYAYHAGQLYPRTVLHVYESLYRDPMVHIHVHGGRHLCCTQGHPILTMRGWIEAAALCTSDRIIAACGRSLPITHMYATCSAPQRVYNLHVEEHHTYVAEGLVVHNCHHVLRENKWGKALSMMPATARGVGFTAWPSRADRKGIGRWAHGIFDALVTGPNMRWLIQHGYLTDYRIITADSHIDLSGVHRSSATGDWTPQGLGKAMRRSNIVGDVVEAYKKWALGKLGVTFVVDLEEAQRVADAYNAAGVPALMVSSEMSDIERAQAMRRFRSREVHQLVNVDLLGEGVDVPAIEVVSMARPTMSRSVFIQQFGRALRKLEGKSLGLIIDHVANWVEHGVPDRAVPLNLDSSVREKDKSDTIPCRACPECTMVYERIYSYCPYCGHEPIPEGRSRPEQVDGEMRLLDEATLARLRGEIEANQQPPILRVPFGADYTTQGRLQKLYQQKLAAHPAKLQALEGLRQAMAGWCGWQQKQGLNDSMIQRLFFHRFGLDVYSAQALDVEPAGKLAMRILAEMAANKIFIDTVVN